MGFKIFRSFRAKALPDDASSLQAALEQAQELKRAGRLAEARVLCEANLIQRPDHADSLLLLAELATKLKDAAQAKELYAKVIALNPANAVGYYKRGNLLKDENDLQGALLDYERAIAVDPHHANAFCNRGVVLQRLGRLELALDSLTRAIELNPQDGLAHYNRASMFRELKQPESALESYGTAVAINPGFFEAHCNRGALLIELKRWDAASQSLERSVALAPGFAPAYFNRAALHHKRRRREEAMADYNHAIALAPDYAAAYAGRGILWSELAYNDSALADFRKALELNPRHAEAHLGQADVLFQSRQFEAAVESYETALELDSDARYVLGMRRHAQMNLCEWSGFEADLRQLTAGIEAGKPVTPPFPVTALLDSALMQRSAAEIYVREEYPEDNALGEITRSVRGRKIKVGYFSADFRSHPVALLTAELFELHDRDRFEVIAFAFGPSPEPDDPMRARLELGFDRFLDVRHQSDSAVAALARQIGIDIAVDLGGFTSYSRTGIFALRAAPIQLSYIGYLGTIGAPYMDYLIADKTIIPADKQQGYSEKIVYLPSYQVNDSQRRMSGRIFSREELGLPPAGFVFCCFNAAYKITPATFALWMRILNRVPESSLFLYVNNHAGRERLLKQAEKQGIAARRIVFAAHIPIDDYLARFRAMNLFLDTFPYNAGTTASDALWSGLPVLTRAGDGFASRVAASLLNSLDMPELITATPAQYENLAVEIATDEKLLMSLNDKLARNRRTSALFDPKRFVAHLECAFEQIHSRAQAGLPNEHIHVADAV